MTDFDQAGPCPGEALSGAQPAVPAFETLRQVGVLVVDDQDYVRYALEIALREAGLLVWLASGGPEALALYQRHAAAIDVVLLDVRMAGMDGPQTLAALRKLDPKVRCCFLSGDFDGYSAVQLRDLSAGAVLSKQAPLGMIIRAVRLLAGPVEAGQPVG